MGEPNSQKPRRIHQENYKSPWKQWEDKTFPALELNQLKWSSYPHHNID